MDLESRWIHVIDQRFLLEHPQKEPFIQSNTAFHFPSVDAIGALNTLQSNFEIVKAIRDSGNALNKNAIPEMVEWVSRIGYKPSDFDRLNPIHVAGTKGKGSTSAFISSILAEYLPSSSQPKPLLQNIGLYTSPHLRFVRERIQINNQPLSEEDFARYFYEVWDRLEDAARAKSEPTDKRAKPVYFRYLTLMALHAYMSKGVDTAVIECGIGGEYDSTNIIVSPTTTAITSLGIDHIHLLGNTIEEIAWHKGGIMKSNAPAFTAPQSPGALEVLQKRAAEIPTPLHIVQRNPALASIILGLAGDFQHINASLAVATASSHLLSIGHPGPLPSSSLEPEFIRGLEQVRLPGRCETRREKHITWSIDSGHTLESIDVAGAWFASKIPPRTKEGKERTRILLFNQQTRDANALAKALHLALATAIHDEKPFTHAVFCTNVAFKESGQEADLMSVGVDTNAVESLEVQRGLADTWRQIDDATVVKVKGTVEEAIAWCRDVAEDDAAGEVMVLVTGSVHLVGAFLEVLETAR